MPSGYPARTYKNHGYNPYEDRIDVWVRCRVCGFWNDDERTERPEEFGGITYETSGTTYHPDAPRDPADWQAVDYDVTPIVTPYGACAFCGYDHRYGRGPEDMRR